MRISEQKSSVAAHDRLLSLPPGPVCACQVRLLICLTNLFTTGSESRSRLLVILSCMKLLCRAYGQPSVRNPDEDDFPLLQHLCDASSRCCPVQKFCNVTVLVTHAGSQLDVWRWSSEIASRKCKFSSGISWPGAQTSLCISAAKAKLYGCHQILGIHTLISIVESRANTVRLWSGAGDAGTMPCCNAPLPAPLASAHHIQDFRPQRSRDSRPGVPGPEPVLWYPPLWSSYSWACEGIHQLIDTLLHGMAHPMLYPNLHFAFRLICWLLLYSFGMKPHKRFSRLKRSPAYVHWQNYFAARLITNIVSFQYAQYWRK